MAEQAKRLKTVFTAPVRGEDGAEKETELAVVRPGPKVISDAQRAWNRAFHEAVESRAILRAKLEDVLRRQNLWDDEKKAEAERLNAEVLEKTKVLVNGGVKMSVAKAAALRLRELRAELDRLYADRNSLDAATAEAQADNARFNFLLSQCLVYNQGDNSRVFKDVDEYLSRQEEGFAFKAATHLAAMLAGGGDPDWRKKLPENAFLIKYGLVDEKLRLVNKARHLIDREGRLINEDGRYVDAEGRFVNRDGERVDEAGQPVADDPKPFLDDETGQPVATAQDNGVAA